MKIWIENRTNWNRLVLDFDDDLKFSNGTFNTEIRLNSDEKLFVEISPSDLEKMLRKVIDFTERFS